MYVPIPPPQRTKMGPQRRQRIYVGFESSSIIKYLEPITGDQFTARLPDVLIDTKKVTKSHIPPKNVSTRLEVPEVILTQSKASESQIRRKRGRPLGFKDANPRKRKEHIVSINHDANVTTSNVSEDKISEAILSEDSKRNEQDLEDSYEMFINYAHNSLGWYRKEIEINDIFAYSVATEIMNEDENDPQTMEECRH
ncbi:UNVERIFIED_CONTAM: hypothetical protein Slati_0805800 [Sesamum latifolium]|uniref:Uncharacterized protein n=1 Tax=Sesamum latifolium TaxID=2727402 RepID=A0AAW2XPJ4_9LAMI